MVPYRGHAVSEQSWEAGQQRAIMMNMLCYWQLQLLNTGECDNQLYTVLNCDVISESVNDSKGCVTGSFLELQGAQNIMYKPREDD